MSEDLEKIEEKEEGIKEPDKRELEIEGRARLHGWVPREEFRGDQEYWLDAEAFLKKGEERPAISRERFAELERRLYHQQGINAQFGQYHQQVVERLEKSHKQQIATLQREQRQAAAEQDMERFDKLGQEIKDLEEIKAVTKPLEQSKEPPEVNTDVIRQWVEDGNEWYVENPMLAREAFEIANKLCITKPHLQGRAQLDEVTRIIKKTFSPHFDPGGDKQFLAVQSGRRTTAVQSATDVRPVTSGKKTYADLPEEGKKQCDMFVKSIEGFTREQYVKDYDWEAR